MAGIGHGDSAPLGPGLAVLFLIGRATGAGQPHIVAALGHFYQLNQNSNLRRPIRVVIANGPIVLVNQAIAEVQAGIHLAVQDIEWNSSISGLCFPAP